MAQAEIQIGDLTVPVVQEMNFADTLAIERVTDMDVQEWSEELDARQLVGGRMNSTLTAGLLAWWIQHARQRWSASRVSDFIRQIPPEQMASIGEQLSELTKDEEVEDPEATAGQRPASDSPDSSSSSTTEPSDDSENTSPSPTGNPLSHSSLPV